MHFRWVWLYYSSVHSHFNDCSLSNIYDALGSWRVSLLKLVTPGLCLLLQRAGLEIDWLINSLINQQQKKNIPIIYLCKDDFFSSQLFPSGVAKANLLPPSTSIPIQVPLYTQFSSFLFLLASCLAFPISASFFGYVQCWGSAIPSPVQPSQAGLSSFVSKILSMHCSSGVLIPAVVHSGHFQSEAPSPVFSSVSPNHTSLVSSLKKGR